MYDFQRSVDSNVNEDQEDQIDSGARVHSLPEPILVAPEYSEPPLKRQRTISEDATERLKLEIKQKDEKEQSKKKKEEIKDTKMSLIFQHYYDDCEQKRIPQTDENLQRFREAFMKTKEY